MGKNNTNLSWNSLPWKEFHIKLFQLQRRIFRAMQTENIQDTIKFQKMLLTSKAVYFMAIKKVTAEKNRNANINLNYDAVLKLVLKLQDKLQYWEYNTIKKVCSNIEYKKRNCLELSTLEDDIVFCIWHYALEPIYNASFFTNAYGFRPYKTCLDLQKEILFQFNYVKKKAVKKIVTVKIENSFADLNYDLFLKNLIFPLDFKTSLMKALNNLLVINISLENLNIQPNKNLFSLLINFILCGIENISINNTSCYGLRYLNSIVYILDSYEDENILLEKIITFCKTKGMKIFFDTIYLVSSSKQFDFIHWHFVITNSLTITSYPSTDNWIIYRDTIKSLLQASTYPIKKRLEKIKMTTFNWCNNHRYSDMSKIKLQLYSLENWYIRYLRKKTNISKIDFYFSLKYVLDS